MLHRRRHGACTVETIFLSPPELRFMGFSELGSRGEVCLEQFSETALKSLSKEWLKRIETGR